MLAWFKYSKTADDWHATIIEKADFAMPRHGYLLCVRGNLDPNNKGKPLFGLDWHKGQAFISLEHRLSTMGNGTISLQLLTEKAQ